MDERKMCASCIYRGRGFENRDAIGIQHCTLLDRIGERACIDNDHSQWEKEDDHDPS